MSDIPEYLELQRERTRIKMEIARLTGRDFSSIVREFDKEIDEVFKKADNKLLLSSQDFNSLISELLKKIKVSGSRHLQSGTNSLIDLNEQIRKSLEFNYPVDYSLFPQTVNPDTGLINEVRGLLNNYRDSKLTETTTKRLIKRKFHVPVYQADGYVNTQLAGFDNTASKTLADLAGLEVAIYFGSISSNTREFCKELLRSNRSWTENEIREMDNGQGLPVIRYCGGYRCQHEWVWVDKNWSSVKRLLGRAN